MNEKACAQTSTPPIQMVHISGGTKETDGWVRNKESLRLSLSLSGNGQAPNIGVFLRGQSAVVMDRITATAYAVSRINDRLLFLLFFLVKDDAM